MQSPISSRVLDLSTDAHTISIFHFIQNVTNILKILLQFQKMFGSDQNMIKHDPYWSNIWARAELFEYEVSLKIPLRKR